MKLRAFAISLLLLIIPITAAAQIEITAPGQQAIPLAVTRFLPQGGVVHPEIAAEMDKVLQYDLDLSGLFRLIDPAAFLSDARQPGLNSTQVDFGQWRLLGAEAVIKGAYTVQGDQLTLEARLFDTTGRRLLTGRRYLGKPGDARRMAHAFADEVTRPWLRVDVDAHRPRSADLLLQRLAELSLVRVVLGKAVLHRDRTLGKRDAQVPPADFLHDFVTLGGRQPVQDARGLADTCGDLQGREAVDGAATVEEVDSGAAELRQREALPVRRGIDPAALLDQLALHARRERDRAAETARAQPQEIGREAPEPRRGAQGAKSRTRATSTRPPERRTCSISGASPCSSASLATR